MALAIIEQSKSLVSFSGQLCQFPKQVATSIDTNLAQFNV
jgi:hypothetical protein